MNISVIIPVYNAAAFLEKAVDSALFFDEVKEILLIDDCSTDNSLEICQLLVKKDLRVKLYQHPDKGNHGAAATRNLGLEKAKSEYIAFLDADDYYLPNRFDSEKIIFKDPKIEGVFGAIGVEFLSEKGKAEYQEKFKDSQLTTVNFSAEGTDVFKGLLGLTPKPFGHFFHLNTLTLRKTGLEKTNLRFNKKLRVHQDSDFIFKLAYKCYLKTGIIDQPVAIRGVHNDNRITKLKLYSSAYYRNMAALHQSLYIWSKEVTLENPYSEKIKLNYLSFKIADEKGIKKWLFFFFAAIFNPQILKTRYRFHA
ncbi:MAG: glycosyltransferase family 2 protein, partial [Chryseobacterium sp.]